VIIRSWSTYGAEPCELYSFREYLNTRRSQEKGGWSLEGHVCHDFGCFNQEVSNLVCEVGG
jgi:hypothetical protein